MHDVRRLFLFRLFGLHMPHHVRARLHSRWLTLPNILTASRLIATPFIVWGLVIGWWKLVFALFVYAGLTDLLDGWLARRLNDYSIVGAYLDPIADKVLFVSCFVTLFLIQFPSMSIPWWFVALVLGREALILGGAVLVVWQRPQAKVAPTRLGKLTTFGYTVLVGWLFLCYFCGWAPQKSFSVGLIVVAASAFISLLEYLWRGLQWMFAS